MDTPKKIAQARVVDATVAAQPSDSPIFQKIVDKLTDAAIEERATKIASGFELLEKFEKDLAKSKPDQVTFDPEGNQQAVYSQAAFKSRTELTQKIEKLSKALESVFAGPEGYQQFSDALDKLSKG